MKITLYQILIHSYKKNSKNKKNAVYVFDIQHFMFLMIILIDMIH